MKAISFFLFLFISATIGHNWLISPPSFDGNVAFAQTSNQPCDPGSLSTEFIVKQTTKGGSMSVTWNMGHASTTPTVPHVLYLVPESMEANLESLTPTSAGVVAYLSDLPTQNGATTQSGTLAWSPPVPFGRYILQYRWSNFRNCAPVGIIPSNAQAISGQAGNYSIPNGKLDLTTGKIVCNTAYTLNKQKNGCTMNTAAAVFLAIFIILMVSLLVVVALVILRRVGVLPQGLANAVEKGENKVFCRSGSSHPTNA